MCIGPPPPKPSNGPPARRSVLSRVGRCIKRFFIQPPRIPDTLFSPALTSHSVVEEYIALVRSSPYLTARASNVLLESVVSYRRDRSAWAGNAILILHFRHPGYPHAMTSICLERDWWEGCRVPTDLIAVTTTESDAELIYAEHVVCQTLTFPAQGPAPTILDVLALAQLERDRLYAAEKASRGSVEYARRIYTALATLFHGPADAPGDDAALNAPASEKLDPEIKALAVALPAARAFLQTRPVSETALSTKLERQTAEMTAQQATIERNDAEMAALQAKIDALEAAAAAAIAKEFDERRRFNLPPML
ncbi:hypothetical protein DFH09DRAFT_1109150 [Mycena vulgaris]|nr:hypothetical protein DFH09DRAFT_1109150 [Mycena vulgaris]